MIYGYTIFVAERKVSLRETDAYNLWVRQKSQI